MIRSIKQWMERSKHENQKWWHDFEYDRVSGMLLRGWSIDSVENHFKFSEHPKAVNDAIRDWNDVTKNIERREREARKVISDYKVSTNLINAMKEAIK